VQAHNFKAEPNPGGGRIDLSWVNPSAAEFPGFSRIRILRREFTQPMLTVDSGGAIQIEKPSIEIYTEAPVPAPPFERVGLFSDNGLNGGTVYYYAIFAEGTKGGNLVVGPPVHASALAASPWRSGAELYRGLPEIYRHYDLVKPPAGLGLDGDHGQLRRLVEMFGLQFDLLRSFARGMRDFADIDRLEGSLLPLLGDWIGWPTNFTLPYAKQRNEIAFAAHYFRTAGIAANLLATVNRLSKTDWKPEIKEFVHNVFLSNSPEELFIEEVGRIGDAWPAPDLLRPKLTTLDVAYEGRPFALRSDNRDWLFYHARQSVTRRPAPGRAPVSQDECHLWLKTYDNGEWLPAHRLTFEGDINKYPTVALGPDGNKWLFYAAYPLRGGARVPEIRLRLFDAGRAAQPARLGSTNPGPFDFANGAQFQITIEHGQNKIDRVVTLRPEQFNRINDNQIDGVTAAELAAHLDRELPGVTVRVDENGTISIATLATGATAELIVDPTSEVATKIGPLTLEKGRDPVPAQLKGAVSGRFSLTDGDTLLVSRDARPPASVVFATKDFANIKNATVQEVAAAINRVLPGVAAEDGGKLLLKSPSAGERASISVDVSGSTAASKLGFGRVPPATAVADAEPAAVSINGQIWLFWSSRGAAPPSTKEIWRIWYNRFDGAAWGSAKPLTAVDDRTADADREPAVAFDRGDRGANQPTLHVFWSRKKSNGLWNVFSGRTTNLDFDTLTDGAWTKTELTPITVPPVPPETRIDRIEPFPIVLAPGKLELYLSSNETNGWQVWMTRLNLGVQEQLAQITSDQFTHRAPVALRTADGVKLWFRANESEPYISKLYQAARTVDARYAGSTTWDSGNQKKLANRKLYQDVLRYSYDTGRGDDDWYARDTVGILYKPPPGEPDRIVELKLKYIEKALGRALPIQVRAVLIRKP
jgi:hypothetical protein